MNKEISCSMCGKKFREDDNLYVCSLCGDILCVSCSLKHKEVEDNVQKDYQHVLNKPCDTCGSLVIELFYCEYCDEYVCVDCSLTHNQKKHQKRTSFKDFVKDKVIDGLKEKDKTAFYDEYGDYVFNRGGKNA